MYRESASFAQLKSWLTVALCPVAVQLGASGVWWKSGGLALLGLLGAWIAWQWGKWDGWVLTAGGLILALFAGQILKESAQVWQGNSYPTVPLCLLALAVWSAWKGTVGAVRIGCILYWVVLIVYPLVFGAAWSDVHWDRIREGESLRWELGVVCLLPSLGRLLVQDKEVRRLWITPIAFVTVAAILTTGILGSAAELGFYEMVRSIDLFGVVKHFDAAISATATLGWFSLMSYLLTLCGSIAENLTGKGRWGVIIGAGIAGIGVLCNITIPMVVIGLLAAIFWVVIPILTQGIERIKKVKKSEKDS